MVYNVHILTHLAQVVFYCGCLWAYSNFVFESGNGQLVRYLKGTKSVVDEICKKYILMQTVSECFDLWPVQDHVRDFSEKVLTFGCTKSEVKQGVQKYMEWKGTDFLSKRVARLRHSLVANADAQIVLIHRLVETLSTCLSLPLSIVYVVYVIKFTLFFSFRS